MGDRIAQTKREYAVQRIVQGIDSGLYPRGKRMPMNSVLAKQFGVSEGTVSNALYDAQRAGYMQDKPGVNSPWYASNAPGTVPEVSILLREARAQLVQVKAHLDGAVEAHRIAVARVDAAISSVMPEE